MIKFESDQMYLKIILEKTAKIKYHCIWIPETRMPAMSENKEFLKVFRYSRTFLKRMKHCLFYRLFTEGRYKVQPVFERCTLFFRKFSVEPYKHFFSKKSLSPVPCRHPLLVPCNGSPGMTPTPNDRENFLTRIFQKFPKIVYFK